MACKIVDVFNRPEVKGEFGVEIEMELNEPSAPYLDQWKRTSDGSLRGYGYEYNLKTPLSKKEAEEAIFDLYLQVKKYANILPVTRAGVHIHVNVQQMIEEDVMKFILLYLILENVLMKWCGPSREGNMFCLRMKDAFGMYNALSQTIKNGTFRNVISDEYRYASINMAALLKFGSLEFRGLLTPTSPDPVVKWLGLINSIKEAVPLFPNKVDLVEGLSRQGVVPFLTGIFGSGIKDLLYDEVQEDIYEGIRIVQPIVYEEWKFIEELPPKPKRKKATTMADYVAELRDGPIGVGAPAFINAPNRWPELNHNDERGARLRNTRLYRRDNHFRNIVEGLGMEENPFNALYFPENNFHV